MRELSVNEIQMINGGSILADYWNDVKTIIRELPSVYQEAINSTTDMMCTATGNC